MTERIVAVVQARLGSSRLPGKALLALRGRPMLAHVIERVLAAPVDRVVLAIPSTERDLPLCVLAKQLGIGYYAGSEHDVLSRVYAAASFNNADIIVRVTADCPFWAPDVCAVALAKFCDREGDYEYLWNDTARSGYPDGTDVEIFTREALERTQDHVPPYDLMALDERADREHVTPWMRRNLRCGSIASAEDYSRLKLSVDRQQDYDAAQRLASHLRDGDYSLAATLAAYRLTEDA